MGNESFWRYEDACTAYIGLTTQTLHINCGCTLSFVWVFTSLHRWLSKLFSFRCLISFPFSRIFTLFGNGSKEWFHRFHPCFIIRSLKLTSLTCRLHDILAPRASPRTANTYGEVTKFSAIFLSIREVYIGEKSFYYVSHKHTKKALDVYK